MLVCWLNFEIKGELKSRNERFVLTLGGYNQKVDRKLRACTEPLLPNSDENNLTKKMYTPQLFLREMMLSLIYEQAPQ